VHLKPVDRYSIKNPYDQYSYVQGIKQDEPYSYLRTSQFEIKKESVYKYGNYTLEKRSIPGSGVYAWYIIDGVSKQIQDRIDTYLTNELIENADISFGCTEDNGFSGEYYFSIHGLYISKHIFSMERELNISCGGAFYPTAATIPVNFDMRTGDVLELEDVLKLSEKPVPKGNEDSLSKYRSEIYAPLLVKLFQTLYPKEMQQAKSEEDCDYTETQFWEDAYWYVTEQGLYISPDYPHAWANCNNPEFSYIPFDVLKKYASIVALP
jgi:hypothetical protein